MDPAATERDSRLVDLLDQALAELRAGQPMETATWQEQYPDLAEDLPALLETLRDLDTAARSWRGEHTLAPERTGPAEAAPPVELPARIGRYEILEVLGAGGMGRVYKARDPDLGRVVAVKVPHFDGSADVRARRKARFLREARAAAAVRHPHVCPIYDVGEEGGLPFVVMAFIDGQSLADRLRTQGRYDDPRAAAALVRQVASALEAVHAHGILHRDLKPGNILLEAHGPQPVGLGQPYLADFGLARPGDSADHLTVEGELMGTPAYMAAEQATGAVEQVGPWTDVYSLGVVLYQMLTGRLPFEGPTTLSVLHQIASAAAPPPSHFRGDLDPGLEAIVQKALARRPDERYRAARELAEALDRWADTAPLPLREGAPPRPDSLPVPAGPAPPTVAQTPPVAGGKEQTVILSGLPDGQALKLALPAGAKADVKVTMTGEPGGKRKKKRPWRVTVSISLSVAVLLLTVGLILSLNLAENEAPPAEAIAQAKRAGAQSGPGGPFEFTPPTGLTGQEAPRPAEGTTGIGPSGVGNVSVPGGKEAPPPFVCLQFVETRPEGEVVSEVLARVKGDELVAELPRYVKSVPDGPQTVVMRLADRTSLVVKAKFHDGRLVAPWSRELTARTNARSKAPDPKRRDKLRLAEDAYRKLVAQHPNISEARNNLGVVLADQGRFAEAVAAFRTAIQMSPNHAEAHTNLGNALWQQGKLAEAEAAYRRALALKPDNAEAYTNLGNALRQQKRLAEAMAAYTQAILLKPNYAEAYNNRGLAYRALGSRDRAEADFRQAVALLGLPRQAYAGGYSQQGYGLRMENPYVRQDNPYQVPMDEPAVTVMFQRVASLPRTQQDVAAAATVLGLLRSAEGPGPHLTALALVDRVGRGDQPPVPLLRPAVPNLMARVAPPKVELVHLQTGGLQVRYANTDRVLLTLQRPAAPVTDLALSPDGKRLALASGDGVVRLWDVAQHREVLALRGHTGRVNSVRFSPDGKALVSGAEDRTVKVWDVATGKPIRRLAAHRGVSAVAFSPDGKLLLTAGKDGQARLWDAASGKVLAETPWSAEPIRDATFSADGGFLLTTSGSAAHAWAVPTMIGD
jgi:serine/threonine protein kinase/tetratricopeptide (TPR) repeat protein